MQTICGKCIQNKQAVNACFQIKCFKPALTCNDPVCKCHSDHEGCLKNLKWINIKDKLLKKLMTSNNQNKSFLQKIEKLYDQLNKEVQKSYFEFQLQANILSLNAIQSQIYTKLKQSKYGQLNGNKFHQLFIDFSMEDTNVLVNLKKIDAEIKKINQTVQILIKSLGALLKIDKVKKTWINSKITDDYNFLTSLFQHKNIKFNLLFRASQNDFSTTKFHEKTDGKQNTLLLVKTQFNKIIGGYTPIKRGKNNFYATSPSKSTFLFSITQKNKIPILANFDKQVYQNVQGPAFGGGHDLFICDKSNINLCTGLIGHTYKSDIFTPTQQSYTKWTGQVNGNQFKAVQWELHQVEFI